MTRLIERKMCSTVVVVAYSALFAGPVHRTTQSATFRSSRSDPSANLSADCILQQQRKHISQDMVLQLKRLLLIRHAEVIWHPVLDLCAADHDIARSLVTCDPSLAPIFCHLLYQCEMNLKVKGFIGKSADGHIMIS